MAEITQNVLRKKAGPALWYKPDAGLHDADKYYQGAMLCADTADSDFIKDGADTANFKFVGVSREFKDTTASSYTDGDESIEVYCSGDFFFNDASGSIEPGDDVYLANNNEVDLVGDVTNNVYVGKAIAKDCFGTSGLTRVRLFG